MNDNQKQNFLADIFKAFPWRGAIGFFIVFAGFGFLFLLVYKSVPEVNKDIVMFCAGLVLGMMKEVSGFFFGDSKSKADSDKAAHAKDLLTDKTPTDGQ